MLPQKGSKWRAHCHHKSPKSRRIKAIAYIKSTLASDVYSYFEARKHKTPGLITITVMNGIENQSSGLFMWIRFCQETTSDVKFIAFEQWYENLGREIQFWIQTSRNNLTFPSDWKKNRFFLLHLIEVKIFILSLRRPLALNM